MSRKLRIAEYELLLDKLTQRFRAWSVKCLSYAGRLQLIASVISSMVNFWISACILPKGCLKRIDSLCSRFLWSSSMEVSKSARVAWNVVCLPRKEGGTGLQKFSERNKALCLRLIWKLFTSHESLWANWHRIHHIKKKSFWELKETATISWNWRMLLRLRPLAERFLRCTLGNGEIASFWFDHWLPNGPLIKITGGLGPTILGVASSARVADVVEENRWRISQPRSEALLLLHAQLTAVPLPRPSAMQDTYSWYVNDRVNNDYAAYPTWEEIRERGEEQQWAKVVWYKGAIPKHAFHMWLAQLDRLPTRQRLANWGQIQSSTCCLCNEVETRDHLFLCCTLATQIWQWTFLRLSPAQTTFNTWEDLILWQSSSTTEAPALIRKTVGQTIVYHLWLHRNNIIHNNGGQPDIFRLIDRDIRNIISSKRHRKKWRNLMTCWIR